MSRLSIKTISKHSSQGQPCSRGRLHRLPFAVAAFEQTNKIPPVSLHAGGHTGTEADRRDQSKDQYQTGKADLRQASGHCRADVCQHLCAEAHEPLHVTDQVESRCTMEAVRSGTQYRQAPHIWGIPLDPFNPDRPTAAFKG